MEDERLIQALYRMVELQEQILSELRHRLPKMASATAVHHTEFMTRQQVKDYLGISESTYRRKILDGTLKPVKMPGGHRFHRHDLEVPFKESIRRGRL